jgi:hypothetical protein
MFVPQVAQLHAAPPSQTRVWYEAGSSLLWQAASRLVRQHFRDAAQSVIGESRARPPLEQGTYGLRGSFNPPRN